MLDLMTALNLFFQGLTLMGNAFVMLLQLAFEALGIQPPEWATRVIMVGLSSFLLWRFKKALPKFVLAFLIFFALSTLIGFLTPILNA